MGFTEEEVKGFYQIFEKSGFLYFDGSKYMFTGGRTFKVVKTFLKELGFPEICNSVPDLESVAFKYFKGSFSYADFATVVGQYSGKNLPEKEKHGTEFLPIVELQEITDASYNLDEQVGDFNSFVKSLIPVINVKKGSEDKIILLDPKRGNMPVLDIDPDVYLMFKKMRIENLIAGLEMGTVTAVMPAFDPYTLNSLFIKETKESLIKMHHVNYYIAPRWRFKKVAAAFRGFIKSLMNHLFPVEAERDYVLDWLHYAITARNNTVLCLVGARGTGKGVLMSILSELMGERYTEVVNQEILTDKFNGAFKNKRLVFFDEVDITTDKELAKFRAFCNDRIVVEEKRQDSETVENFASLALTSNNRKDFRVEPQERRFSVPEVSEEKLETSISYEEISNFINERIRDPENTEVAEFGMFLIERKPKESSYRPLKGKYFFNLCKLSMPEWKAYLIEYVQVNGKIGESINLSEVTKKFKNIYDKAVAFPTKRGTIEMFLIDYIHDGYAKLGTYLEYEDKDKGRRVKAIMPTKEFLEKYGSNYNTQFTTKIDVVVSSTRKIETDDEDEIESEESEDEDCGL